MREEPLLPDLLEFLYAELLFFCSQRPTLGQAPIQLLLRRFCVISGMANQGVILGLIAGMDIGSGGEALKALLVVLAFGVL